MWTHRRAVALSSATAFVFATSSFKPEIESRTFDARSLTILASGLYISTALGDMAFTKLWSAGGG
jgi:hypothetical protein